LDKLKSYFSPVGQQVVYKC